MIIAILALQGAFAEHQQMLSRIGVGSCLVRNLQDWEHYLSLFADGSLDHRPAMIFPGGESTAMRRIMRDECLVEPLRKAIHSGMPVFGTCAGMILLATEVIDTVDASKMLIDDTSLALPVKEPGDGFVVHRNAYGRQLGSFYAEEEVEGLGVIPMTFIRAPYIERAGKDIKVLAKIDGHIVCARQSNILVSSFHPELNDDTRLHEYFVNMIKSDQTI